MTMRVKLTDRFLQSIKPGSDLVPAEGKRNRIWDATNGYGDFGVRVTSRTAVTFFVMRRIKGQPKPETISLGRYDDGSTSLFAAREKADDVVRQMRKGIDPREVEAEQRKAKAAQKKAEEVRKGNVFSNAAETFIKRYVSTKRTAVPIAQLIRREFVSRWGAKPITEITRADAIAMIEEIAERSPSAADQARIYGQLLFSWALERDVYGLQASPFHAIKAARLIPNLPGHRDRVLTDAELRLIWEGAWPVPDAEDVYPVGQFIRLLLLLGCRRGELSDMTWNEVDLEKATWTLQGSRTKNGDPRLIPLPRLAVEILAATPRFTGPFVFSTTYGKRPISGFAKIKQALDRRITKLNDDKPIAGFRLHDLRRSMRTNLSALAILPLVAEMMIGHRQRGVAAVYDLHRYEAEQRAGFEAWCRRLLSIVDPVNNDNVLSISLAHQ
jgi:integrase